MIKITYTSTHMLYFYTQKIASTSPHPSTNKTPSAMFISLQSYYHNVWAIQKEIKDAYPKKVCHMPIRHVKKKRKDAYPKKVCHTPTRCVKREREREKENMAHTKNITME